MRDKAKTIKIIRSESAPETTELIAAEITAISNAFERLQNGKLTQRAILLLLKGLLPGMSITDISKVLNAAADLKKHYLKKQS